jgi:hypothetical protein
MSWALDSKPRDTEAHTFVQWKGTDLCMDVECSSCGGMFHVDGYFAYKVMCPSCEQVYELSTRLLVRKVEPSDDMPLIGVINH